MSRPLMMVAVAIVAVALVGFIVIAQDQGPGSDATRIDAPTTSVDTDDRGTSVRAPGTAVDTDESGTRVQAPGVDITVPNRDRE